MKTIWKFPLVITGEQTVEMPGRAKILTVQVQDGVPCLWAVVDPQVPTRPRIIECHGTGNPSVKPGADLDHIGTVQMAPFVWHFFERNSQ